MNINKINEIYTFLVAFVNEAKTKDFTLTSVTRMKIAQNLLELRKFVELYEEQRVALVKRYGKPAEDNPENISVAKDSPNYAEFEAEIKALLELDREVKIDKLSKDDVFGPKSSANQVSIDILTELIRLEVIT